jgi:hypothetical protein
MMKTHRIVEGSLSHTDIENATHVLQREVARVRAEYAMDPRRIANLQDPEVFYGYVAGTLIASLQAKVAMKRYAVKTVSFPDGVWQSVKHALRVSTFTGGWWLVRWWMKHRPVRYVEVTLEANAYHPDLAIPDHETFVEVLSREETTYAHA